MGQETSHVFAACPGKASSPLLPLVALRFLSVELVFVPRDHYMAHGGVSPSGKRSHKCTPAAECSKRFLTLLIPMPPADLCLSCPDRTLSGEMWQKQSPHSSGCLPVVLAHTTAPLPHRWAQGTTGGFGWVWPPRQGLVPPSVLGCWGCSLLCSLVSPLRPLLCCSVTVLFSVSPLKIKGVWEYSLFFHEKGLCFFFLPFPSCSIA